MKTKRRKMKFRRQMGLSLVEIMLAMLLGLFLTGGILQIFASSRMTYKVHEATSRMQETGRMALEVLARDIRGADFWGCSSDIGNVTNNLDSSGAGYVDYSSGGVIGTEGGSDPDSLVLRGGVSTGLGVEPPYGPQPSANIKVPNPNDLAEGDIIFVSDCSSADIFQITNANPDSGVLVHNTGATVSPGNYNVSNPGCPGSNAHCLSKVYGADASILTPQEIAYSIGAGSEGEPALFRNGFEYLDGVEDLQLLYGEDVDGSGIANYYVPADQVTDMENVISVRLAIVTRSYEDNLTGGIKQSYSVLGENRTAADNRLRQVYSTTVTVRNRL
jgi:type IV pilus assembly protein PilW